MNYGRVYAEFIRDRSAKQPSELEYFEVHHIRPRCLGGLDEQLNLIRLTPEDHYFAHLVLAHMHGGKLWAAVFLMSARDGIGEIVRSRPAYGRARRAWSVLEKGKDGLKGADNGNHNPTRYSWRNLDTGELHASTLHDMWRLYGGTRGIWTSAATPNSGKPSALGWAINDGTERLRSHKGKTFQFVNRDGRTFRGTQSEFCSSFGLSPASGTRVVRYRSVTVCGWRLFGVEDRNWAFSRATGQAARLGNGSSYRIEREGEVHIGHRQEVAALIGSTAVQFSAGWGCIKSGRMRSYKGWTVEKTATV